MAEPLGTDFDYDESVQEFAVSGHDYLKKRPNAGFDLIATSVLVVSVVTTSEPRILLLQRAASDSNANKWEPPGGACDDEDISILHGAARELWEEAGLQVAHFDAVVDEPYLFKLRRGPTVARYHFAVRITSRGSPVVKLNPEEHQNFVWASEAEIAARKSGNIDLEFTNDHIEKILMLAIRKQSQQH